MLDPTIVTLLDDQFGKELFSAYLYLSMANYYEEASLNGFANWFFVQAQEERDHAMLIRTYLLDNNCLLYTSGVLHRFLCGSAVGDAALHPDGKPIRCNGGEEGLSLIHISGVEGYFKHPPAVPVAEVVMQRVVALVVVAVSKRILQAVSLLFSSYKL